jgi:uncharacterized protein (DUF697 family)
VSERELAARQTVKRYMGWSAGGALIPIPVADMIAITGAQLKMLAEIAKIYDVPFEAIRAKAIIGSLIAYVLHPAVSTGLLGSLLLKGIPGVGALFGTPALVLFAGAYAWALGRVFIQHFEFGGTFLDFDLEKAKQHFQAQFAEGQQRAATMTAGEKAEP